MKTQVSQLNLIKEYFIKNANQDIPHNKVVPWLMAEVNEEAKLKV